MSFTIVFGEGQYEVPRTLFTASSLIAISPDQTFTDCSVCIAPDTFEMMGKAGDNFRIVVTTILYVAQACVFKYMWDEVRRASRLHVNA